MATPSSLSTCLLGDRTRDECRAPQPSAGLPEEQVMVTIHDLTWDDNRLLDLFILMSKRDQGRLMAQASIAGCHAVEARKGLSSKPAAKATPKAVTLKALWRCAPSLPCGWVSDTGFGWEVENTVKMRLGDGAIDMILTTADHDQENAEILADWAGEHAQRIGSGYCAPDFSEEGYVAVEAMKLFIEEWRDSFMTNLLRAEICPSDRG